MSSLVQPKPGSATIGYPGSKIQTRNRRPVRVNYPLKKQFASVNSLQLSNNNISRVVSCNSWYPSTHSKFNSFHALREQNHQARPLINGASSSYYGSYHADENQNSDATRNILIPVFGIGGVLIMFVWGSERIPYSGRIHLNFLPRELERKLGEFSFNYVKKTLKGKILPQTHWKSVRVRVIANDIIEALKKGLRDDKGVEESSGEAKKGSKVATYLLEGLDWETLVVDEPIINAYCCPGGKILVYTGLLDYFRSDAEVASVLAHEVGHAVARHGPEYISNSLCFEFLKITLNTLFRNTGDTTSLDKACKYLLVYLPFSRRIEREADYIGLLLLASAGYDPRVAIQMCEKFGELEDGGSFLGDYLDTHPSEKKRAQLLSQDKVMEEALGIYREPNFNRDSKDEFRTVVAFGKVLFCYASLYCFVFCCAKKPR